MVRTPVGKARKRRRPSGRRSSARRRDPEVYVPEPNPDAPAARPRRTGDWEQWLDPPPRTAEQVPEPSVAPERRRVPRAGGGHRAPGEGRNLAPPPALINRCGLHPLYPGPPGRPPPARTPAVRP